MNINKFSCTVNDSVGVQNEPPLNETLWYVDYFEVKVILASGSRKFLPLPWLSRRTSIRSLAHNKQLSEITSFDLCLGQDKILFTNHVLFLSSCSDLLKLPRAPYLIPSSRCFIDPRSLSISEPPMNRGPLTVSCMQGSHTHTRIKLDYFLLLISCLFDY